MNAVIRLKPENCPSLYRAKQRLKSGVISASASLLNWVNEHIVAPGDDIAWQDHLRWFIEGLVERVFGWAWDGSDEELESVYSAGVPVKYMSLQQKAMLYLSPCEFVAHCIHCDWQGDLSDAERDECPECGEAIYAEVFEEQIQ